MKDNKPSKSHIDPGDSAEDVLYEAVAAFEKADTPHERIAVVSHMLVGLRSVCGLTNPQIAEQSGLSLSRIQHYVRGAGSHLVMRSHHPKDAFRLCGHSFKP